MSDAVGGGRNGVTEDEFLHVLVGEARMPASDPVWQLESISRPSVELVDKLIEVYSMRAHWFMLLLHLPSLKARIRGLWATKTWHRSDAGTVLVILAVIALGALCTPKDDHSLAQLASEQYDCSMSSLADILVAEVKEHLLDLLGDCSVQSVQLCMVLCRYYANVGNSGIAWSLVGMASRNAYAAGLHLEPTDFSDPVHNENRRRIWLAVKMCDVFTAFFHGRPPSLDSNFPYPSAPSQMNDLELPPSLASHPALVCHDFKIDLLTFHIFKYQLYDIMGRSLSSFRRFRQDSRCGSNIRALVQSVKETEAALLQWRLQLPPFFDRETWTNDDPLGTHQLPQHSGRREAKILTLQSHTLQVIFDSTVIVLNRPILELATSDVAANHDVLSPETVAAATDAAVASALRTSRVPLHLFEDELPASFILMSNLTAAVILCLPPLRAPMSSKAHDAKSGILRIIRGCQKLSPNIALAEHMSRLLSSLMSTVVQQETAAAVILDQDEEKRRNRARSSTSLSASANDVYRNGMADVETTWRNHAQGQSVSPIVGRTDSSGHMNGMAGVPSYILNLY